MRWKEKPMSECINPNTNQHDNDSTSSPTPYLQLREVLELVRPEMAKLEADHLLQITVDPVTAATIARGALPRLLELRGQLAELPGFDIQNLDKLQLYARAMAQANAVYLGASAPPQHFQKLVAEATAMREQLVSDASALAKRGYLDGAKLDQLKGSVGYRNVASDLLTVVNMITSNWTNIAGKTALTIEELDRAYFLGDQLIDDIGTRALAPAAVKKATLDRQQIYTVLVNAWEEVRRAVTFVRWDFRDADVIAPSFFSGKRHKTSDGEETETEAGDNVPSANPTAPPANLARQPATAAGPAAATSSPKTGVGLPGSDPFSN
jgi:hypothetical protein